MSERGVPSAGAVEAFDELEDRRPCGLSVRPRVTVDQLSFESRDEALGHRVLVGVGHRARRGSESGFFEAATELNRGVLATPVGVVDQS